MDCHRQLGCLEEELRTKLSRYLDGETAGPEAAAIEDHVKDCGRCRDELAELRGVDRTIARSVGKVKASPGFVRRVLAAISGRRKSKRLAGSGAPRPLVWGIIALAAVGAVALAVLVAIRLSGGPEPLRETKFAVARAWPAEENPPLWRERRADGRAFVEMQPGERVHAGTVLELEPAGAPGAIERPDGLKVFVAPGTCLAVDESATRQRGISLVGGRVLVVGPEGSAPFALGLGEGTRLMLFGSRARLFARLKAGKASVTAMEGSAGLGGPWGSAALGAREEATIESGGPPAVSGGKDLRALDLGFAPPEFRPSPWPEVGGSPAREGRTPFALALPPRKMLDLDGASGPSAPVIGPDGTVYFLVGPAPGRLVGVRGWRVAVSVPLEDPFVGDPAVAPDGAVFVATRTGVLRYGPAGGGLDEIVRLKPDDIPVKGPTVAPGGGIYVVSGRGLAAYGPDGRPLWARDDIRSASPPSVGPDGAVYVATISGKLHALNGGTGSDRGTAATPVDEPFLAHVAVASDGTAYAVSSTRYLAWRSADGRTGRVTLPASEYVLAPAIAPSGEVVVASAAGVIHRLPPRPDEPPGTPFFEAGGRIVRGPLVDGEGRVVVLTATGGLVAVEPSGRSRTWELGVGAGSPMAVSRNGAVIFVTREGSVFGR